ncbi:MAG: hypothetical protein NTY38_30435 [Acidobacteria bacterium]|nr:hypothetical protein [Acidobacteriota bacterium]
MKTVLLLSFLLAAVPRLIAQGGVRDPAFSRVPFDEWLQGRNETPMRWSLSVDRAMLSYHQRLMVRCELRIDGKELLRRSREGHLAIFVQIEDPAGALYQDHGLIDLSKLKEGGKTDYLSYSQFLFVLPGEYRADVALFDTATREHSVREEKFRVSALRDDPLSDAWRDLPPVQFLSSTEAPDLWYQPALPGRLSLPVTPRRPLQIEVLANLTPSERLSASLRVRDRNLSILIPALKTISQIDCSGSTLNAALLDLSRRRIPFREANVRNLDWLRMKQAFAEVDPATIDIKSLEDRSRSASFFVREVESRIAPSRVVIVLSRPVTFVTSQDARPAAEPAASGYRLFYIRLLPPPPPARFSSPEDSLRRGRRSFQGRMPGGLDRFDQLAPLLKPLGPRVFDVETPAQFRKALAAILAEIERM